MRRRWWWLPVAVAIAGIAITVVAARISQGRARAARRIQLERAAAELGFAVTERVQVPAEALQTIGAIIGHTPTIDRTTFETIAQSVHARTPRIYALEWAPLVALGQRAELEARVQGESPGWQIREPGAKTKEVALDLFDHGRDLGVGEIGADETQPGIELVDVAVCGHARVGLGDSRAAKQARIAAVAGPGVDFHASDYGHRRTRTAVKTGEPGPQMERAGTTDGREGNGRHA